MSRIAQLLCFYFLYSGVIFAQDEVKSIRISEFHFQNGIGFNSGQHFGLADYKILAPSSELLTNDFSTFQGNEYFIFNGPTSSSYQTIQLGLTFKSNPNPLWRIGISHIALGDISKGFSKSTIVPYDTLTSSQTGQQYFLDSTYSENYNTRYSAQQLRLETSLIYRTDPSKRWSVYTGLGASFGISYNAQTVIEYTSYNNASTMNEYYTTTEQGKNIVEYFQNKMNFSTAIFIPMGVDFRMGKNREFWKRLHLYYEMKPSITYTAIPELKRITTVNLINSFGIKVTF
jgi:hypothetical protein